MARYKIYFRESARQDLGILPKKKLQKILHRIEALSENPGLSGCEKLTGEERYRIRQGRYRISYSIQDEESTVWVVKIGHREDVYR
jgi:mRNA interferase RelE/StbE